jgi:hypothetical protein
MSSVMVVRERLGGRNVLARSVGDVAMTATVLSSTMAMGNPYSYEVRLLMCPQCGAALDVPEGGGHCRCDYCGAVSDWQRRAATAASTSAATDEETRLASLWKQREQGSALEPAPEIAHLFVPGRGQMKPDCEEEALAAFQQARAELGRSANAAERLFLLTIGLYNAFADRQRKQRALMETAAELLAEPRHRQVLHGMMARNACRAGDLDSAQQWLGLMDRRSSDIHADSAYRLTRSYIETTLGSYPEVLGLLGNGVGEAPLSAKDELLCSVLRANAQEHTGNVPEAARQLAMFMKHAQHLAVLIGQIIAANPTLKLCPQSYPAAMAQL